MRMPGPRRGFDPVRVVKINPQLIDGVLADNRQILLAGLPRHLMLLKQREKPGGQTPCTSGSRNMRL